MAKKEKGGTGVVPRVVDATGDAGALPVVESLPVGFVSDLPKVEFDNGPIFELYGSVLASVDWQRDVRKRLTICRDAFKIAVLAYEVFQENIKNKELT
jgi:hypothetical protein